METKMGVKNAVIESCEICDVCNGVLGIRMVLIGNGWSYECDRYSMGSIVHRTGSGVFGDVVATMLGVFEKDEWGKLPGTPVRVEFDDDGTFRCVGNFIKDEWFSIKSIIDSGENEQKICEDERGDYYWPVAKIVWGADDVRESLRSQGFADSDKNVETLMANRLGRTIEDLSIERGWGIIEELIGVYEEELDKVEDDQSR